MVRPSALAFDSLSSHSTQVTDSSRSANEKLPFQFDEAVIIGKGSPNHPWAKCVLADGEQAFIYPDDEDTVLVKQLPVGTRLYVTPRRQAKNPGPTKYVLNAVHIELQTEHCKAAIAEIGSDAADNSQQLPLPQTHEVVLEMTLPDATIQFPDPTQFQGKKPRLTCEHSYARQSFIDRIADHYKLEGQNKRAEALGLIVDMCMAGSNL
jgi:hypothetical protein